MQSAFYRRAGSLVKAVADSAPVTKQYVSPARSIQQCYKRSISNTCTRRQEAAAPTVEPATNSRNTSQLSEPLRSLTSGLDDPPPVLDENEKQVDWTRSFHGLSAESFTEEQSAILQKEVDIEDIEVKPDGIVYLPEIKYRRILNRAFKPGGWGLAPRGETIVTQKLVTREYALVANGRLISIARGEQQYFDPEGIPTATEGCKSNALMRCCKDLGIASELWDPRFIRGFLKEHARETIVEHTITKKRRKHWMRKDDVIRGPFKEINDPIRTVVTPSPSAKTPSAPARK